MVSDLLLDVYACPADPSRWPAVLDALRRKLRVRCAALQYLEQQGAALKVKWQVRDSASEANVTHHAPYISGDTNPRVHQALTPTGILELALHRAVDDARDFDRADEEFISMLMPHLQQSVQLAERLDEERGMRLNLQTAVDHLQCGLLLCDHEARPNWLNQTATQILLRRSSLSLTGERLTAATAQETAMLRRAIATSRHQCLVLGNLQILVVGLTGKVMVLLSERGAPPELPPEIIARLFALTPAESRLAAALCQGASVADYAHTQQVSVGTARFQLKQVLAKTRTARQSDLVREVCTSVAVHALKPRTS